MHANTGVARTLQGLVVLAIGSVAGCFNPFGNNAEFYERNDLVADQDGMATHTDANLINPWGLAYGTETFFWVANNGTGTSTLYAGDGTVENAMVGGAVTIPAAGSSGRASPTGIVYNDSDGFEIGTASKTAPSQFLLVTLEGTILGWSADVDQRSALVAVDNTGDGVSYTGAAIATDNGTTRLYASDFMGRKIDVFDEDFAPATDLDTDAFRDRDLPDDYGPFNIQELNGRLYVAYAKMEPGGDEEVTGMGLGWINVFEPDGRFIEKVASGGMLDAPWGMAMAPNDFGQYGGALLVGNFGDGRITVFDADNYEILGQLETEKGRPVEIEGLWGLMFGNGLQAGDADRLYFTAGPDDETHGMFGSIGPKKR